MARLVVLLLCALGPAAALVAGIQRRATPSLVAHPSVRCCAAEEVVEEASPSCDFPGCDGRGRALGGLGAIPLFSWWPIKVSPSLCIHRTPAPEPARLRTPALVSPAQDALLQPPPPPLQLPPLLLLQLLLRLRLRMLR